MAKSATSPTVTPSKFNGYNCYPGSGWRKYGRLIVNFHRYRATSVFFNGELLWEAAR